MEEIEDPQSFQRSQFPNGFVEMAELIVVEEQRLKAEKTLEDALDGGQPVVMEIDFRQMTVFCKRRNACQQIVIEPQIGQVEKPVGREKRREREREMQNVQEKRRERQKKT